jgi:hypothetical protein
MNERIKELMLEAGYAAPELAGRANKLAELVVKECAYIVENSPWQLSRGYKAVDQANLLKVHFGVK